MILNRGIAPYSGDSVMIETNTPRTFADWLAANAPASVADACVAACATRGKRKGQLLASVPTRKGKRAAEDESAAIGAWRALMSCASVQRAGMFALMFADDDEASTFRLVDAWLRRLHLAGAPEPYGHFVVRFASGIDRGWHRSSVSDADLERLARVARIDAAALGVNR